MTNTNEKTGIRFGYIRGDSLHPDVVYDLLYSSHSVNLSYKANLAEAKARAEEQADEIEEWVEDAMHLAGDHELPKHVRDAVHGALTSAAYLRRGHGDREAFVSSFVEDLMEYEYSQGEEEEIEGDLDGVHYVTSWLGGALNFFILESPRTTLVRSLCSPCVPNAGDLDSGKAEFSVEGDRGYLCYDVPAEWRDTE